MAFQSILFNRIDDDIQAEGVDIPYCFDDLNLDQVIEAITVSRQDYRLKWFFYKPLTTIDAIHYRQEVMKDLEDSRVFGSIQVFSKKMVLMRRYLKLIEQLYYAYHKQGWFLEAVIEYCQAVAGLAKDLNHVSLNSRGLLAFREYIIEYTSSERFLELIASTNHVKEALSNVKYAIIIRGSRVLVRKYEDEIDYSQEVEQTFEKFKQGAVEDYLVKHGYASGMNHVEAQILDCTARLFPEVFSELENFCNTHLDFLEKTIAVFDREIQFYLAYLEFIAKFQSGGLKFCYPVISAADKDVCVYNGFDLALANKLIAEQSTVITNDFYLTGRERIIVISGPNQGGKTTFARMFGQLHYLASLGCPVPGTKARLFLFDRIYTHFEREEDIQNLRGKLKDDLVRINDILTNATPNSILIMNEIFTSTTLSDAVYLSKEVLSKVNEADLLCVIVTFIDELAVMSEKTISMVSTVVPENPAERTFKIIRKPADGLAYAISIAEKYRLTYEDLMERLN